MGFNISIKQNDDDYFYKQNLLATFLIDICNFTVEQLCNDGSWHWWMARLGTVIIGILGMTGNLLSYIIFSMNKTFKKSSYANFLKYLCITDSINILFELSKSLNKLLKYLQIKSFIIYNENNFTCKFFNYFCSTLQLISVLLVCAFSIERCIAVVKPLSVKILFSVSKTRIVFILITAYAFVTQTVRLPFVQVSCPLSNINETYNARTPVVVPFKHFKQESCLFRCECEAVSNKYGIFLLKFHAYFHQLTCLVIIPSVVVTVCNLIVILRILQRKRRFNLKYSFMKRPAVIPPPPTPILTLAIHKKQDILNAKPCVGGSSGPKATNLLSSASSSCSSVSTIKQNEPTSKPINTHVFGSSKLYTNEIALYLLILVSTSFLVLVLPETVLNIYKFHIWQKSIEDALHKTTYDFDLVCLEFKIVAKYLYIFEDIFLLLKLFNYGSIYLVYLVLIHRFGIKTRLILTYLKNFFLCKKNGNQNGNNSSSCGDSSSHRLQRRPTPHMNVKNSILKKARRLNRHNRTI